MPSITLLRILSVLLAGSWVAPLAGAEATEPAESKPRPNLLVIMSDDMGFSDLGCYGSEIATPNLDALAANGLRFTQFYNTARCCPTRAALLTGLYPHQAGIGHMMQDRGHDGYRGDLNRNSVTIAETLRPAGYRTYATGKWHVTKAVNATTDAEKHNWPLQRGFDRFYGTISGAGNFWDPQHLTRDNTKISPFADPEYQPSEPYYYTDAISDQAARFVREHHAAQGQAPFFLYVAYTAAHWPMHARESDIAKYKGRYAAGYDAIRRERYERQVALGLVSREASTVTPTPAGERDTPDWEWDQRNMEVFAAMIDRMDQGIGRLVAALRETGQFDNTLICFLQDNGGCAENLGRQGVGEPRPEQPTLPVIPNEATRSDYPAKQTRDGYPVRQGKGVMAGPTDTWIGYGEAWAAVSNTPFREYKHWVHEGGISTPLIVHWPRGLAAGREGKLEPTPGHLIDIMATCVDLGGATYPKEKDGHAIKPLPGRSLAPLFAASPEPPPARKLFWEHEGNRAVRDGEWKLVAKEDQPWELYHLAADRSEQHNLADAHPERVRELAAHWQAYAAASDVLPLGTWRADADARSTAKHFTLRAGDRLARVQAPDIASRPFTIEAAFTAPADASGVVLAHGGTRHGYALYVAEGRLHFVARRDGETTTVSQPLATGARTAVAALDAKGRLSLKLDDQSETTTSAPGALLSMPADPLEIGRDGQGRVGPYGAKNAFTGEVTRLTIDLGDKVK